MDNYREELQLRSEPAQKEAFRNLTRENKVRIWQSKLNQILKQDITTKQRVLVESLRDEIVKLNSNDYDGIRLIELGISMAQITLKMNL